MLVEAVGSAPQSTWRVAGAPPSGTLQSHMDFRGFVSALAAADRTVVAPVFEARGRPADACRAAAPNAPNRGHAADSRVVTVSDAKLRDIGVGADIFFERGPEPGLDARKPNATAAAKAKAKEAAGHGDLFVATTDASQGVGVKKPSLVSRPAGATDMHEPTHRIFSSEVDDSAADPHEATRKLVGGKQVSETLKRSLFEGSKLFDDDAEREAVSYTHLTLPTILLV